MEVNPTKRRKRDRGCGCGCGCGCGGCAVSAVSVTSQHCSSLPENWHGAYQWNIISRYFGKNGVVKEKSDAKR